MASDITKRIGAISPAKRELLLKILEQKKGKTAAPPPITRMGPGPHPLSFAQQRLWFLDQWEPGSTSYNIVNAVLVKGPLHLDAFRRALDEIVQRHESLRTTFKSVDGQPFQATVPTLSVPLPVEDIQHLEGAEQQEHLHRWMAEEAQRSFDLIEGPLLRAALLKLGAETYVLFLAMHHIVSDAWSFSVFVKEMVALYEAFCAGSSSPLPDLALQYADFAVWQRRWLDGAVREAQIAYWKQQLANASSLDLPADRPRPPIQRFRGASLTFEVPRALPGPLLELSHRTEVTLFMTLLAAFHVLLSRYTGSDDVCVGTPVAGRNRAQIEGIIGLFVNMLVLRTNIEGDPTFLELLARVREVTLGAYDHQDVPFEQVVDALQPTRDLSRTPLFQVVFVLQNAPLPTLKLPDLEISLLPVPVSTAQFDLTLTIEGVGDDMRATIEYNTDLLDAATIRRMWGNFEILLAGIVADPGRPISRLPLLTDAERHQLLTEWNPHAAFAVDACVHELFEAQVARTPDAVALIFEDRTLTYQELNTRANQLAHRLRKLGVRPDVLVGLCVERSVEMVVGLLGILKAGGAYVPLDPAYPRQRLSFMAEDAKLSIVLTQEHVAARLPAYGGEVVRVDADRTVIDLEPEALVGPVPGEGPHNLAYVIYTSGSTGKPKGVEILHRSVVNFLASMRRRPGIEAHDRLLAVTSLSFDIAGLEIFLPLTVGARVEVVSRVVASDGAALLDRLSCSGTTLIQATPATFRLLLEAGWRGSSDLKILVGGEAVPRDLVNALVDRAASVWNMYGPTETTIWSCIHQIERGDGSVSIGRPIANTQAYILDRHLDVVPIGVPGELHLGGDGLARGYLDRPELTAERFIESPFDRHARLYKTGDLCRYTSDGTIEFLGRLDHQVKIRGHRVEIGEIEAALEQHPAIREVVALAREDTPGDKRLVAYVVTRDGLAPSTSELRSFLTEKLPEYMVPAAFVLLDALPLTTNGKVDRRALPAPTHARPELQGTIVGPRTPAEHALAKIWIQVLGIEQVGLHDNFFELGGDSILSIQIIARARQAGLTLTPKQLFERPTIAGLIQVAGRSGPVAADQGVVTGPAPLTPIQRWFFERPRVDAHHFNQAMLVELRRPVKPPLLKEVIRHLLLHHDALRLRFFRNETGFRQEIAAPDEGLPFTLVDLSLQPEGEQRASMQREAAALQASLNLSHGPLVRVALFELGAERPSRLLMLVHHLAIDGVSWRILLEDLQAAVEQMDRGEPVRLAPKTISFRRWAEQIVAYAGSAAVEGDLSYWLEVARAKAARLPVDFPEYTNHVASVRTVSVSLSAHETQALLQNVPGVYRTQINDILLTAWAQVVTKWTGASTVLIDLEGHGREDIGAALDVSRTVGWFTTIFPVRLDLSAGADAGRALKSIKEQLRRIPRRGMSYGLLRYLAGKPEITEALGALPGAEVSFNYLGQVDGITASSWFALLSEPIGPDHSPRDARRHLLDVVSVIAGGQLRIDLLYSEEVHRAATIETLALDFVGALRGLIAHCLSPDAGGYTPSDFPLSDVGQSTLDQLFGADRGIEDMYPLTAMQKGMLFQTLYAPESGVYFEQTLCTLIGAFDVLTFQQAWQHVIARHPTLRTSCLWEGLEEPLQVVHRHAVLPWDIEDWRGLSKAEQNEHLDRFLEANRERSFDLARAPLMRIALLRCEEDAHFIVASYHHLLLDGWCSSVLLKEAFTFYNALQSGADVQLERSRPFRDYIAWLQRQDLTRAEAFWRGTLEGFTAPTPLVVGQPSEVRPDGTARYVELWSELSSAASEALVTFARRHRLTLNTLAQGAWALLLSRYSGEEDVVFGNIVSGRPAEIEGVESMVGLFINTVPVRIRALSEQSVLSFLQRIHEQQAEAQQYEYTPLTQIQKWSDVPRGQHLFESLVVFENFPVDAAMRLPAQGLEIRGTQTVERTYYPLTVTVAPGPRIAVRLSYWDNRFDDAAITRMVEHFKVLLEGLVADPERRVFTVPLLTDAERRQSLVEWNDTRADYPASSCVHELFEAQTERTPDAVAVVCGDQQLTYQELNQRANELAHYLRSIGVGPETLVGLCVERSLEMVIGLLGVLKAGGAYVPLDPSYPLERLTFMLEDAGIAVLLTLDRLVDVLPAHPSILMCLDTEWERAAGQGTENLTSAVTPENLAYVIYTSGSTGRPKGTLIMHRSVVNYLTWAARTYPAAQGAPVHSSLAFDLTVTSLLAPLVAGGRVVLLPEEKGIDALASAVGGSEEFGLIKLTPVHLRLLNQHLSGQGPTGRVRSLVIGGEQLTAEILSPWRDRSPETLLFNEYGPTETVVGSCIYRVPAGAELAGAISIGRPIANTQIYVLDRHAQPVPVGVPGELHIAGAGLARGYLNRPELTAQKFVQNPFADQPSACMYKTGDLARWLPNGNLEYLGRVDHQVKIRGFRIELGEVEAVLGQQPGVEEVVVVAQEDTPGNKRLVAYVVLSKDEPPSVSDLRRFLKERLPDYMIPALFVMLDALPITSNGKVNRNALPAPDQATPEGGRALVAPRNPTEETLARIWMQVLNVKHAGIHDDFFELGGDSILSLQVVSKAQAARIGLSVRQLLEHPTIAELAALASTVSTSQAEQGLVIGPVTLTPIQHWFFERELPSPHRFNQVILLEAHEALDPLLLDEAMTYLLRHHDALRLRFLHEGGAWRQFNVGPEKRSHVTTVDLSATPPEQRAQAIEAAAAEAQISLCLDQGPLVRMTLMNLGVDQRARLLITVHHLAVDGVSWRILMEDLQTVYTQLRQRQAVRLPLKTTSFQQWAERLSVYAQSDVVKSELPFWLAASRAAVAPIPVDMANGPNTAASARTLELSLSTEETQALLQSVPAAYHAQINDILLTALGQALAPWSGSRSLRVDLEGHGREEIASDVDLSRTVGWFTTIFPVHLELPDDSPEVVLNAVKEQMRRMPNRGIGYGLLRYLHSDPAIAEQLRACPRPEVSLNYLGQFDQSLQPSSGFSLARESSGLALSPLALRTQLLEISGWVTGAQLHVGWTYSDNIHHRSSIEALAQRFLEILRVFIAGCPKADVDMRPPASHDLAPEQPKGERRPQAPVPSRLWSPLVDIQPLGRGRPFFCVHGGGGTVVFYAELARHLGAERPIYGIQARGVEDDQPPNTRIEDMAAQYIAALRVVQPQGPYLLGGYSFGGTVAFEMARQLSEEGQAIGLLAIMDMAAPHELPNVYEGWDDAMYLYDIAHLQNIDVSVDELRRLGPDEQLSHVLYAAWKVNALPLGVGTHELHQLLSVYKAHVDARQSYVARAASVPITLLRVGGGMPAPVGWPAEIRRDVTLGWARFSTQPIDILEISGDHETLFKEPHVPVLAARLQQCLRAADPPHGLPEVR